MPMRCVSACAICLALVLSLGVGVQARYTHSDPASVGRSQYANIAPLPGAGTAISATGQPDGQGAFQVNIPVAYTPGWGYVAASAYTGAHIDGATDEFGNGSGVFAAGFFGGPRLFVSAMKVSHLWDESLAVSAQVSIRPETSRAPEIAVGCQDILGKETDGTSPYVALTKSLLFGGRRVIATVGFGGGRFLDNAFGGLSMPLGDSFNLAVENDGYQFNTGVGWRPGGRDGKLTILGGYNSKCGLLFGANIAGWFSSR